MNRMLAVTPKILMVKELPHLLVRNNGVYSLQIYIAITAMSMGLAAQVHADVQTADTPKKETQYGYTHLTVNNQSGQGSTSANAKPSPSKSSQYCGPCGCETQKGEVNVQGSLLYMCPELIGLEVAFGSTTIGANATTINGVGTTITTVTETDTSPSWKWDLGFRVGADAAIYCFDLDSFWTHFQGKGSYGKNGQSGLWTIHYDTIDLLFGKRICLAPSFYFKPFFGARGAIIKQTLDCNLTTLFTSSLIGNNTVTTVKKDSEKTWGVGPELGLEADWYMGWNLSLYGSFDFVTYYGKVHGQNLDTDNFTQTISISNGNTYRPFLSIATDLAAGIRWDRCVDCKKCNINFMLMAGLEQHRIYDFSDLGADGTLSIDGGVFAVDIGFRY